MLVVTSVTIELIKKNLSQKVLYGNIVHSTLEIDYLLLFLLRKLSTGKYLVRSTI